MFKKCSQMIVQRGVSNDGIDKKHFQNLKVIQGSFQRGELFSWKNPRKRSLVSPTMIATRF